MITLLLLMPLFLLTTFPDGTQCNDSLWNHVYHSYRLQILNSCVQATGIIDEIRVEKDGDYHIRIHLDNNYTNLLNDVNISRQGGDLVVEPICIHEVTQQDAIRSCSDYSSNLVIPPIGTHVIISGSWVTDTLHGWNEIHPLSQIIPYTATPEFPIVEIMFVLGLFGGLILLGLFYRLEYKK